MQPSAKTSNLNSFNEQQTTELVKEKWTMSENKQLFLLYNQKKNHWKEISKCINNRNDNSVKNQFFALLRKGLRKACRSVGLTHNTMKINTFKPKVLLDFFEKSFVFNFENVPVNIVVSELIEKFALTAGVNTRSADPQMGQVVHELIDSLTKAK